MPRKLGLLGALVVALIIATAIAAVAGAAQSASPSIKPRTGNPKTKFVLRFHAPEATMPGRRYTIAANTSSHSSKCVSSASAIVGQATAGETVKVKLSPSSGDRKWCLGKFHGTIDLTQGPICDPMPGYACPEYAVQDQQVGKFSFRVRRKSS